MLASSIVYEQVTKMISPNYITSPLDILTGNKNNTRNIVSVKSVITTVYIKYYRENMGRTLRRTI